MHDEYIRMIEKATNNVMTKNSRAQRANGFLDLLKKNRDGSIVYIDHLMDCIIKVFSEKHHTHRDFFYTAGIEDKLVLTLDDLINALPDHDIRGKKILDLGCGSTGRTYEANFMNEKRQFEPWVSRILLELGADVTGIDVGKIDEERFTHFNLDLTIDNSLAFIQDESYDAVLALAFYDSPELRQRTDYIQMAEVKKILYPQIERVLKSDGTYLEDRKIYTKSDLTSWIKSF